MMSGTGLAWRGRIIVPVFLFFFNSGSVHASDANDIYNNVSIIHDLSKCLPTSDSTKKANDGACDQEKESSNSSGKKDNI